MEKGPQGQRLSAPAVVFLCRCMLDCPWLCWFHCDRLGDGNWGLAAILTMIAVTKSTDAGAYFSGKTFGKHKLIPRLSPGKTREGCRGRNRNRHDRCIRLPEMAFSGDRGGGNRAGRRHPRSRDLTSLYGGLCAWDRSWQSPE